MAQSTGDRRFPRSFHLSRSSDFLHNRRRGRRGHAEHFTVNLSPGPDKGRRLGLVVSRKVGPAVARNRVKRLVREVFRLNMERIPAGTDVVVIAHAGAGGLGMTQAAGEILECIERLARPRTGEPGK